MWKKERHQNLCVESYNKNFDFVDEIYDGQQLKHKLILVTLLHVLFSCWDIKLAHTQKN
jgi:hypothetical protein